MAERLPIDDVSDGVVRLRRWRADEVGALTDLVRASTDTVGRWIGWANGYTPDKAAQWIAQMDRGWAAGRGECALAVADAATNIPVGCIGINRFRAPATADLGYWMSTAAQGRGWMTRAVRLWVPQAMPVLGLTRLEVLIAEDNTASRRVVEKAGGRYERRSTGLLQPPLEQAWVAVYAFGAGPIDAPAAAAARWLHDDARAAPTDGARA